MEASRLAGVLADRVGPGLRLAGYGLVLREWAEADVDAMPELFDDSEVARWTPLASPFDEAAARSYLQRIAAQRIGGAAVHLAITQDGVRPLGEVILFDRGDAAELGYAVGAAHRCRGLAGRAVTLLAAAASEWGFATLQLRIEPGNLPSEAVALTCGFSRSGEPVQQVDSRGRPVELVVWVRSARSGWPQGPPAPVRVDADPSRGVTPLNSPRAGRQQG